MSSPPGRGPYRTRWCDECERHVKTRRFLSDLLEEVVDLCDPCVTAIYGADDRARSDP